jgi:hypothetical protein
LKKGVFLSSSRSRSRRSRRSKRRRRRRRRRWRRWPRPWPTQEEEGRVMEFRLEGATVSAASFRSAGVRILETRDAKQPSYLRYSSRAGG